MTNEKKVYHLYYSRHDNSKLCLKTQLAFTTLFFPYVVSVLFPAGCMHICPFLKILFSAFPVSLCVVYFFPHLLCFWKGGCFLNTEWENGWIYRSMKESHTVNTWGLILETLPSNECFLGTSVLSFLSMNGISAHETARSALIFNYDNITNLRLVKDNDKEFLTDKKHINYLFLRYVKIISRALLFFIVFLLMPVR